MRGRVVAIMLAVGLGGTPIGAPLIGMVGDAYGPRWAVAVGAASGVAALGVGVYYVVRYRQLRVRLEGARIRVSLSDPAELGGVAEGRTAGDGPGGPAGGAPGGVATESAGRS
jgi:MFS family permease